MSLREDHFPFLVGFFDLETMRGVRKLGLLTQFRHNPCVGFLGTLSGGDRTADHEPV